jgi:hypothetical protein
MSAPNDKKRTLEHVKASILELSIKARKLATEMNAQAGALEGLVYFNEAKLEESTGDAAATTAALETVEMSAEEEAMMAAAEQSQPSEGTGTRNGYPLNDDKDNITFETLLRNHTLDLQRRGDKQQIVPGKNGRRSDVFDNKELFKRTDPRFFFDMNEKVWQRDAPGTTSGV